MLLFSNRRELHSHFFILPFKCDKCGNTFVFEHGLRRYCDGFDFLDRLVEPEETMERYCSICSMEIIESERKENDTAD